MIGKAVESLKLAAMDVKSEIKDIVHDVTKVSPTTVQTDYSKTDSQSIQQLDINYMNIGWNGASQITAHKIDMIVDKMNFVAQQIEVGLLQFDTIEQELRNIVSVGIPPQPAQLLSLADRIDSSQKQVFMGLQTLKNLTIDVDKATDRLQVSTQGWDNKNLGGMKW